MRYVSSSDATWWKNWIAKIEYLEDNFSDIKYFEASERFRLQIKEGKDQISRECTLSLQCFSLEQMEQMQKYFLEPGYSLCIEYGWNSNAGLVNQMPSFGTEAILNAAASRNFR